MSEILEFREFVVADEVQEIMHFTESNVQGAIIEQASLFVYYAGKVSNAQMQSDKFKSRVELLESHIAQELRDEAINNGTKITEAAIKQSIAGDKRYVKAQLMLSKAKAQLDFAKNVLEALKQRKDMIIQIGVAQRQERERKAYVSETADRHGVSEDSVTGLHNEK